MGNHPSYLVCVLFTYYLGVWFAGLNQRDFISLPHVFIFVESQVHGSDTGTLLRSPTYLVESVVCSRVSKEDGIVSTVPHVQHSVVISLMGKFSQLSSAPHLADELIIDLPLVGNFKAVCVLSLQRLVTQGRIDNNIATVCEADKIVDPAESPLTTGAIC